ncbi:toll-like receptor 4 [Patella vulgata]|uniref:toll-like receptor 4 n=1 Tax=Patella vulgata TaxID=6465 RepID=UPI00217F7B12|nr:toll-like receptor 4 [Patella vulgata]
MYKLALFYIVVGTITVVLATAFPSCKPCDCYDDNGTLISKCIHLGLTKVPMTIPNNTNHLIMKKNNLSHICNNSFERFYDLRLLDLSYCIIKRIDENGFAGLWNLDILILNHNQDLGFRGLGKAIFGLRNTSLRIIKANSIVRHYAVCVCIDTLMAGYFKETRIEEIHVNDNRIEFAEPHALSLLPSTLKTIIAKNNRFTIGPYLSEVSNLSNLEVLDFSGHMLEENLTIPIPNSNYSFLKDNFQVPIVDYTKQPEIVYSKDLEPPLVFPPNLKILRIQYYDLAYQVTKIALGPNSLKNVDLRGNVLSRWIGPISGVENITDLNLSQNFCLKIYPEFFDNFTSLQTLEMSLNNLQLSLAMDGNGSIFKSLSSLVNISLAENKLRYLPENVFIGLKKCQFLNLSHNLLDHRVFISLQLMNNLQYVNFSHNHIDWFHSTFRKQLEMAGQRSGNLTVDLTDNPLMCDCDNYYFLQWLVSTPYVQFYNIDQYECYFTNGTRTYLSQSEQIFAQLSKTCHSITGQIITVCCCILGILSLVLGAFVYRFRWKLRYLYYFRNSKTIRHQTDDDFEYDAFISYSDDASLFVDQTMKSKVEQEAGLKLCLHNRDFLPSLTIAEGIVTAVKSSRKTVLVMSPDFIKSYWCLYEMNMADMESQHTGRDVLLILLYKHIEYDKIPSTVMYQIKSHTYIEYPDENNDSDAMVTFWEKFSKAIKSP